MAKITFLVKVRGGGTTTQGVRRNLIIYIPDQARDMLGLEKDASLEVTVKTV